MPKRRNEARDEPILNPGLPIVDAHHHLLMRPHVTYLAQEFLQDANAGHLIKGSVYVETRTFERTTGPEVIRPLGEVEFANGLGAMTVSGAFGPCQLAAGIVGYADLTKGAAVAPLLERCVATAPDRFRGVRQLVLEFDPNRNFPTVIGARPPVGILDHPEFINGLREVAARGLTFDLSIFHDQVPRVLALLDALPDLTFVLNHAGIANGYQLGVQERAEVFDDWRGKLQQVAQRPNVLCKIGGLGMPHWGFGLEHTDGPNLSDRLAETWRPWVETAINAFGPKRCMFESNFPADGFSCGYVPLWNAFKRICAGTTDDTKAALFSETAISTYRLNL
jgi:L-fuconolactonase